MRTRRLPATLAVVLSGVLLMAAPGTAPLAAPTRDASASAALELLRRIPMPGVEGRLGHLAIDLARQRLFVTAPENGSLEVLDLRAGRRVRSVPGLRRPTSVAVIPAAGRVAVSCADDGACVLLDATTLREARRVPLGAWAGELRLDPAAGRLYAAGERGLEVLDPASGERVGHLALGGRPEGFELEPGGTRIFVNLPEAGLLTALDRAVDVASASFPLHGARANYTMAIDGPSHVLFVGCRKPGRILVLDTRALGRSRGGLTASGVSDDLFCDPKRGRIYASCAEGFVEVFGADSLDLASRAEHVPTEPGARTSLFSPEQDRLYVAVPGADGRPAEVRVYRPRP